MKKLGLLRTACAVGVSTVCVFGLAACSGVNNSSDSVAATVNGVEIKESEVTDYIQMIRNQNNMTDEESWGTYLASQGTTPEELRQNIIDNTLVPTQIVIQFAGEEGVEVTDEEIAKEIDTTKAQFIEGEVDPKKADEKWKKALSEAGLSEESYASNIKVGILSQRLQEKFAPADDETESEDLLAEATAAATNYDGSRRSSHILFKAEDEALANEVLAKINSGELDFDAAVQEYSTDEGSKQNNGDIGWDKTSALIEEYTNALNQLSKDQISGLVPSSFGIHIIKCTDIYSAPKTTGDDGAEKITITSLDQLPDGTADSVKQSYIMRKTQENFENWLTSKTESSEIVINPMPENLAYIVDVEKYAKSQTEESSGQVVTSEDGSTTVTTTSEGDVQISEEGTGGEGNSGEANSAETGEAA